ncbi:hypothetical protein M413DRAFT_248037 [Hebeloma cylindrosporum]|uniref:Uncharacterized protein n=1 Tax=Hebeloma cylindrosporum TaxID=76867 RepID=A0A0C2YB36_HEBCY|nr:hypothetical protein M413DRAFT_248037 [Hebeloma cylindrosporum h7]
MLERKPIFDGSRVQFIYPIYPPTNPIHPSIHPSIHPFRPSQIHPSIHLSSVSFCLRGFGVIHLVIVFPCPSPVEGRSGSTPSFATLVDLGRSLFSVSGSWFLDCFFLFFYSFPSFLFFPLVLWIWCRFLVEVVILHSSISFFFLGYLFFFLFFFFVCLFPLSIHGQGSLSIHGQRSLSIHGQRTLSPLTHHPQPPSRYRPLIRLADLDLWTVWSIPREEEDLARFRFVFRIRFCRRAIR